MTRGRNADFQSVRQRTFCPLSLQRVTNPLGAQARRPVFRGAYAPRRKQSLVHAKIRDRESALGPSRTGDSTRGACAPREEARVYDGNGNRRVNSRTLPRIRSRAALSSRFCSASATRSAISSISSSRMPRVVTAGVPTRIPPGLKMG